MISPLRQCFYSNEAYANLRVAEMSRDTGHFGKLPFCRALSQKPPGSGDGTRLRHNEQLGVLIDRPPKEKLTAFSKCLSAVHFQTQMRSDGVKPRGLKAAHTFGLDGWI